LSFGTGTGTGSGIAHVSEADIAPEIHHVMSLEDILDEAIVFTEMQPTIFRRHYTGRILSAVL
jgi:hypothetical protein